MVDNHWGQTVAAKQPASALANGIRVVNFDGAEWMTSALVQDAVWTVDVDEDVEVTIVGKADGYVNNDTVFAISRDAAKGVIQLRQISGSLGLFYRTSVNSTGTIVWPTGPGTAWFSARIVKDGPNIEFFGNGISVGSMSNARALMVSSAEGDTAQKLVIGALYPDGSTGLINGRLADIAIYKTLLTPAQRADDDARLAALVASLSSGGSLSTAFDPTEHAVSWAHPGSDAIVTNDHFEQWSDASGVVEEPPLPPPPPPPDGDNIFVQGGLGAVERTVQSRLLETVSAFDFGALGDESGTLVDEWLTGGQYSRGAADLTELRAMTGIPDLELTDTIDWAAITAANNFAGERPVYLRAGWYKITRPLSFERGGLEGEVVSSGNPINHTRINRVPGSPPSDVIRVVPPGVNRHFYFKNLTISGGTRCFYGATAAQYIEQQSVFSNIYVSGSVEEGFYFDGLQAIGALFDRIIAENCGTHGIRFKGFLNGSQFSNCRSVANGRDGFRFENEDAQAAVPALMISRPVAEYNKGAGIVLLGVQAVLYSPYFEFNNNDATPGEPDLRLASTNTTPSKVHAQVTCIQPYFSGTKEPTGINISGSTGGVQSLLLIDPYLASTVAKVDTDFLDLTIFGRSDRFIVQGDRRPVLVGYPGTNLVGARNANTAGNLLGMRAAPTLPTGIVQVVASHDDGRMASYLVRRNANGTVTALHTAGDDFLTFSVNAGQVMVTTAVGTATVSVHGH